MSDSEEADKLVGKVVGGRYEMIKKLGAGGMGAVYQARQLSMDRLVALKLLHGHYASNKQAVARFNREMQVTARIEHPNTIRVYDFGETDDKQLFLAMEYLEGGTLSDALNTGEPMASERLVHIGLQIARALAAAHSDGVVHRDLKPDNVMLLNRYGERDFVKVLDFGIARFIGEEDAARTQLTADGAVVGTPAYMSPEQATGGGLDHRTDIYSFGVILFEMATGRVPFDAPTTISLMVMHVQDEPPIPSELAPGLVPPALEVLILRMLAKNPEDRPQSVAEVVAALEGALTPPTHLMASPTQLNPGTADTGYAGSVGGADALTRQEGDAGPAAGTAPKSQRTLFIGLAVGVLVAIGVVVALAVGGGGSEVGPSPETAKVETVAEPEADAAVVAAKPETASKASDSVLAETPAPDTTVVAVSEGDAVAAAVDTTPTLAMPGPNRGAFAVIMTAAKEPAAPQHCQAQNETLLGAMVRAATLLDGARYGAPRDQDREALATLRGHRAAGVGSSEYWALSSQARLMAGEAPALALEAASKAAALCDGYAVAHNAVATAHLRLGSAPLATAAYGRAIESAPSYMAPRFNRGVLRLASKDYPGAIAAFSTVIDQDPEYPNVRLLRGQAFLLSKQSERALKELRIAADADPRNSRPWLLLGQAWSEAGDVAESKVAFCKAKELGSKAAIKFCADGDVP
ncbi:MAG: Flp pilus assembly protein TadD [Myxococcota bacterium]